MDRCMVYKSRAEGEIGLLEQDFHLFFVILVIFHAGNRAPANEEAEISNEFTQINILLFYARWRYGHSKENANIVT